MLGMLDDAMRAGAAGLSTGVFYPPGRAADSGEIIPLVSKAGEYGGIYATHMRDEHDAVLDSMREAFEAAGVGGAPLLISHHKCAGARNWDEAGKPWRFSTTPAATQDISVDVYPYDAGSSVLDVDLLEDGMKVLITWSTPHPAASGKYLHEIAGEWGCTEREAGRALKPAGACYFFLSEEDLRRIIPTSVGHDRIRWTAHGPSSASPALGDVSARDSQIRPWSWAFFPRGGDTKDDRPAGAPLRRGRPGVVAVGNYADLVVFDPPDHCGSSHLREPERSVRRHRSCLRQRAAQLEQQERDGWSRGSRPSAASRGGWIKLNSKREQLQAE